MNRERFSVVLNIAFIYIGTIVGAGFASGREIWQFFGVFGDDGRTGVIFAGLFFVIMGLVTTCIARVLRTDDMGRVVFPVNNAAVSRWTGYFMAAMLFIGCIVITSAGGALINQQFGIPRVLGNLAVIVLTCITAIGGLDRIGNVFSRLIPLLIIIVIAVSVTVLAGDFPPGGIQQEIVPSPAADTFGKAALLYASYNMLALIPIVSSTATTGAERTSTALKGALLAGVTLAVLAMLILSALLTDGGYCMAMDMPMLALAAKAGPVANILYTLIMMVAIYASASGAFYAFSTRLGSENKNIKIIIAAAVIFAGSLVGFKFLVAYMLPVQGACGAVIVILTIINFFRVVVFNFVTDQEKKKYDFPDEVINVTTGHGAASLLVTGSEKTALMDCSMAYCGEALVEKIKEHLGDRPLDYMFASHTHYDHIGALPYLKKEWPDLICIGAEHGKEVLKRPGAIKGIKKLGDEAARMFTGGRINSVSVDGLSIDMVVHDGDEISLGDDKKIVVLETPGHTKCSLTYVIEPAGIMLAAESVGVLERKGMCHPVILNSYEDAVKSIEKCRNYGAKRIIISHYGIVPESYNRKLWNLLRNEVEIEKAAIEKMWAEGLDEDQITDAMEKKYWYPGRAGEQPVEAFRINMKSTVRLYRPKNDLQETDS